MVDLQLATTADPVILLPVLLLTVYLERESVLAPVTKPFEKAAELTSHGVIQLYLDDGSMFIDDSVVQKLVDISSIGEDYQHQILVCLLPCFTYTIMILTWSTGQKLDPTKLEPICHKLFDLTDTNG
jgi:hypothetical protein